MQTLSCEVHTKPIYFVATGSIWSWWALKITDKKQDKRLDIKERRVYVFMSFITYIITTFSFVP